jgi:RNA polymerase sigma-70 factor (ECF subfamily)
METTEADIKSTQSTKTNPHQRDIQELTDSITSGLSLFYKQARRRLRSTADVEDAVQDAFLSAYTHFNQFKEHAQISTWLTTIVINSSRTIARRRLQLHISLDQQDRQHHRRTIADKLPDYRPSPEQICRGRELEELLAQLTTRLPPAQSRAFQLNKVDGLTIRETAEALGVRDGTVMSRVARARAILRKRLREPSGGRGARS